MANFAPVPQQQVATLRTLLDRSKEQIALAIPKHMSTDRLTRIAMTAAQKNPELLRCDQVSFVGAVIQAAQIGLEPDGTLGRAYLVPFKGKVQLIPGYLGLLDLARRSGQISTIDAHVVYQDDEFRYSLGLKPELVHVPCESPGELIYVYAIAILKDGGSQFRVMSRREIDKVRDTFSQTGRKGYGPWKDHYDAMAIKTVVRRLCKFLPASIELQKAVSFDEQYTVGIDQNHSAVIDLQHQTQQQDYQSALESVAAQSVASEEKPQPSQLSDSKPPTKPEDPPLPPTLEPESEQPEQMILPEQLEELRKLREELIGGRANKWNGLLQPYGVRVPDQLTYHQATLVLAALMAMKPEESTEIPEPPNSEPESPDLISATQLNQLDELAHEADIELKAIMTQYKVKYLDDLTASQADEIILALKNTLKEQETD